MVIFRVQILNGQPAFQKETLVIIGLISKDIDGNKIHWMITHMVQKFSLLEVVQACHSLLIPMIKVD